MSNTDDFTDLPSFGMAAVPALVGLVAVFTSLVMPTDMGNARLVVATSAVMLLAAAIAVLMLVRRAHRGERRPWSSALRLLAELFVAPRVLLLFAATGAAIIATTPEVAGVLRAPFGVGVGVLCIAWAQTGLMSARR